jgi:hypothetical protein
MTKVYIIDFDRTFAKEHTYHGIWDEIDKRKFTQHDEKAITNYVISSYGVLGDPNAWLLAIENAIANGDKIAFASFTEFGYIIKPFIKAKLGLSDETLNNIIVEAWLPIDENNKNQHIANILSQLNLHDIDPKDVTLIDDTPGNIEDAAKKKYSTMLATKDGAHAAELYQSVTGKLWVSRKTNVGDMARKTNVGDMIGRLFGVIPERVRSQPKQRETDSLLDAGKRRSCC